MALPGMARRGACRRAAQHGGLGKETDQRETPRLRDAKGRMPHAPLRLGQRGLQGHQGLKEPRGEARPIQIEDLEGQEHCHGGNGAGHDRPPSQGFHRKDSPHSRLSDHRRATLLGFA